MTVTELIEKLKGQGITATAAQIEAELGSTDHLTADDVPAIAEMLSGTATRGKRKPAGKLAKPKSGQIAKVEPTEPAALTLPTTAEVSTMQIAEVNEALAQVNQIDHASRDESVLQVMGALYSRQQELTAFVQAASQALSTGNAAMVAAFQGLSATVQTTVQGFNQVDELSQTLSGEGAGKLAESFRSSTNLAARFHSLIARSEATSAAEPDAA